MIYLKKPYIKENKNKSRLIFDIKIDNEEKQIWYEVDNEYAKYLCDDRVDAILVGILHYALVNGHDIKSDSYVTDDILYKINTFLLPSIVNYAKTMTNINISIKTKEAIKGAKGIGTGCSGGIDSLYAIITNKDHKDKNFRLTHLCINNVGAFNNCYKEKSLEDVRKYVINKAKKIAKETNLPLIITDSNYQNVIPEEHYFTSTYSSVFAILCMQKLWKTYYYGSSGLDYSKFSLFDNDENACSHYELLSLDCFSTRNLKIYCDGGAITRFEKIKTIFKNPLLIKYAHVCITKMKNCNHCPKCKGLLLALYVLTDNLDIYKNILDIDYFLENINDYFNWIYEEHFYGKVGMYDPVYNALLEKDDFKNFVKNKEKEILNKKNEEHNYFEDEYYKVIKSKAFRVGSIIMFIPQKIKKFLTKTK